MAKLDKKNLPQDSTNIELEEIKDSTQPKPAQRNCNKVNNRKTWYRPYSKTKVVAKLRPLLVSTGCAEILSGCILLVLVVVYAVDLDSLYGVEKSKTISLLCFGGLVAVVVSGTLLLISVLHDKRSIMWFYVIASTSICIYIFGLAIIMMQYGLHYAPFLEMKLLNSTFSTSTPMTNLSLGQTNSSQVNPEQPAPCTLQGTNFIFSTAFIIALLTLAGSVAHFLGNVAVFTYYNLKYVQPLLFYCYSQDL